MVVAQVRSMVMSKVTMWQEELWTRAVPEQQRLTIQMIRNTIYFAFSGVLIRFFGDQLAI